MHKVESGTPLALALGEIGQIEEALEIAHVTRQSSGLGLGRSDQCLGLLKLA